MKAQNAREKCPFPIISEQYQQHTQKRGHFRPPGAEKA